MAPREDSGGSLIHLQSKNNINKAEASKRGFCSTSSSPRTAQRPSRRQRARGPDGGSVTQLIPSALDLVVKVNDIVKADQALTLDPNVGGFGQTETEIILQNPNRVKGMIVFFFTVTVAQILLVLKKKQFEKVQAAEMNF